MSGILALLGSGEFTKNIIPIDRYLLENTMSPKVSVLPTAAGEEDTWPHWIKMGEKHYRNLGVFVKGFPVVDKLSANDTEIVSELKGYNFFIFSGGDPGYLLSILKDSLVWKAILELHESGATLAGSSAGAMVMGKKVWDNVKEYDKNEVLKDWSDGLGLTEFGVLPHFDQIKNYYGDEKLKEIKSNFPKDLNIIGIDEDTAYIKTSEIWREMGKGKVHNPAKF